MRRYGCGFTLDQGTLEALYGLADAGSKDPRVQLLLPPDDAVPRLEVQELSPLEPLDEHDLKPSDYDSIYKMFKKVRPAAEAERRIGKLTLPAKPETAWSTMQKVFVATNDAVVCAAVEQQAKTLGVFNRRERRKQVTAIRRLETVTRRRESRPQRNRAINVSRIADALILLGLSTLEERLASESARGAKGDVREDGPKRLDAGTSKNIAARAVRGGPRPRRIPPMGGVQAALFPA